MQITTATRTDDVRALAVAMALGSIVGLSVGGAYLAGSFARSAATTPARAGDASPAAPPMAAASPRASARVSGSIRGAATIHADLAFAGAGDGDRRCLAQAVYYEARGESPTGQAAVAQVVLNRARLPSFPKTLCGVVYQRSGDACQFSFACNGAMRGAVDETAWRRAQQVAGRVLRGAGVADVRGATMFHAVGAVGRSGFVNGLMQVAQIGAHVFFRLTGHAGSRFTEPSPRHDLVHASFASLEPQPVPAVFEGPAGSGAQPVASSAPAVSGAGSGTTDATPPPAPEAASTVSTQAS